MSIFNRPSNEEIARITTEYTPSGKIFSKKRDLSSGVFKYFTGVSTEQGRVIDTINEIYDGQFPKTSTALLEYHERDLGIPDETFSGLGSIEDKQRDVIVKKYMMRGNREQDFQAIADIYGVAITISTGIQTAIFPLKFPITFSSSPTEARHTLYIKITETGSFVFPLLFPINFSAQSNVEKVKKIFNRIKPATTKIIYQ